MYRKLLAFSVLMILVNTVVFGDGDGWYTEGDFAPFTRIRMTLTNPLDIERKDCPIVIPRHRMPLASFYEESVFVVDPALPSQPDPTLEQAKALGSGVTLRETNGHHLSYQLDDIDKDGVWDELFFMIDWKLGNSPGGNNY
ncbi:DUF4861 family protein [Candidatus Latescibacterota bacterium]